MAADSSTATGTTLGRWLPVDPPRWVRRVAFACAYGVACAVMMPFAYSIIANLGWWPGLAVPSVAAAAWFLASPLSRAIVEVVRRWRPAELRVGTDGITYRWDGREVFVGYADIDSVRFESIKLAKDQQGAVFAKELAGTFFAGEARAGEIHFSAAPPVLWPAFDAMRRAHDAHWLRWGARGGSAIDQLFAERDGAWGSTEHVDVSGPASAGYREPVLDRSALLAVAEDRDATAERRARAATALGGDLSPGERARLRAVAAVTAHSMLRATLDHVLAVPATRHDAEDGVDPSTPKPVHVRVVPVVTPAPLDALDEGEEAPARSREIAKPRSGR